MKKCNLCCGIQQTSALLLLIILSLPSFSSLHAQTIDPAYERSMTKAALKIENGEYESAAADAREALRIKPDDERAALYLGIALSRTGNKEAEGTLKKALSLNPQNPRTNLELGIYYYDRRIFDEAADYFETAKELAPNTDISLKAQEYLNVLKRGGVVKPWSLNISVGGQYDSNVVLEDGDALPEGISQKSDWRAVFFLKGKYDFLRTDKFEGSVGYSFYQSL
ncbi:MAG: tetratricopeptide repeat protein, partial [Nitrospirota bacterium]